jgi:GntR family transcriptional regulator
MTGNGVQPLKPNKMSLSAQTQRYLLSLIENGVYQPGEQLPSQADLATQLGISRPTLREALLNLEREGIIVRKHGVGTFVAAGYDHRLESGLERLESVLQLAARQGFQVGVDALEVREKPADSELADKLRIAPGVLLTSIRRVIVVDKKPVAYMLDVVLSSILSTEDIDDTFNGSVLDFLRQKMDVQIAQALANIIAVNADLSLAKKLDVKPQQALLLLEEIVYGDEGIAVGFSRNYFIPNFFRFHVIRR